MVGILFLIFFSMIWVCNRAHPPPLLFASIVQRAICLSFSGNVHHRSSFLNWPGDPILGRKGSGAFRLSLGQRSHLTFSYLESASRHQLHATHLTISFSLPSFAFKGQSGSQRRARHRPTISA